MKKWKLYDYGEWTQEKDDAFWAMCYKAEQGKGVNENDK